MAHNFVFIDQDWGAEAYADCIADFETAGGGDGLARLVSGQPRQAAARAAASTTTASAPSAQRAILVMLYALRGTPFIYQGEELGLPDAEIPPERVVDVDGRDPERAPIPWTADAPGHGFTHRRAVAAVRRGRRRASTPRPRTSDPDSTLQPHASARAHCATRRPALVTGAQKPVDAGAGVLAWTREGDGERLFVAVNFTGRAGAARRRAGSSCSPAIPAAKALSAPLELGPSEALILRLAT